MSAAPTGRPDRGYRTLLVVPLLYGSWLLMMVLHELGHVLHGWASGATVTRVMLGPHVLSMTMLEPNPHPLFVAWGGALWGSVLPLGLWGCLALARSSRAYLARFLAGFCLAANGGYLAGGALAMAGDAGDMAALGCPRWLPVLAGLPIFAAGLWLWHRQGRFFGIGPDARTVRRADAVGAAVVVLVLVAGELLFFGGAPA